MSFLKKITKGITAFKNEVNKPNSFIKGEAFEEYVRKYIFPKSDYDLVHRTHDYNANNGDYIESSLKPDFKFRDKKNGKEFYVEVKWRMGIYNRENKIEWCNPKQLKRYKAIDKNESAVFIVLGFGDKATKPKEIVLFPVSGCHYTGLYDSFLDRYLFYVNKPVFSGYLWKLK
ncbi:hypothetical protein POV26_03625 [Aequorivita todarodis]|uniref:hypothetical protein n=1 Tax=Aequorivita todarodis TaxID=2036821 RepID=UPI00234FCCBD|nr:hypothetical protein [Aequorivita todarodis]MDC8000113.1 hypothetical protein [Aequorivita todarodis]